MKCATRLAAGVVAAVVVAGCGSGAAGYLDALSEAGLRDDFAADRQAVQMAQDLCDELDHGAPAEGSEAERIAVQHYCPEYLDAFEVTTTTTSTTTAPVLDIVALEPLRIDCTSELPSFPCEGLIDGDATTDWNAEAGGVGAVITILFNPPVQISEIIFYNLDDPESFARNARIKGIEIKVDDLPQATIEELLDSSQPQRVQLASLRTSRVEITITSAYAGETYDGNEPFPELALKELAFYGRLAPEASS